MNKASEQFIEIGLEQERYGVPIREIQEIIRMQPYTEIPSVKRDIYGVINLRGKIIPILSLRSRFQLPAAAESRYSRIVIVNIAGDSIGVVVDKVYRVTSFTRIHPPQDGAKGVHSSFIDGIGENESKHPLISILNLQTILHGGDFNE